MSITDIPPIPHDTVHAVLSGATVRPFFREVGDNLAELLEMCHIDVLADERANLRPPIPILALATYFQTREHLTDLEAVTALSHRVEWKYALHLPLNGPSFAPRLLCDYRQGLQIDPIAGREFQCLLNQFASLTEEEAPAPGEEWILLLGGVCLINRFDWILAATRSVLEALAGQWPDWLRKQARPEWYARYTGQPTKLSSPAQFSAVARDARSLLELVTEQGEPEMASLDEVIALKKLWNDQFMVRSAPYKDFVLRNYCYRCALSHRYTWRKESGSNGF